MVGEVGDVQHYEGTGTMIYVAWIIGWRPHEICLYCQPQPCPHWKMVHSDLHCMSLDQTRKIICEIDKYGVTPHHQQCQQLSEASQGILRSL